MLSDPVEFDIERLLGHFGCHEAGQEVVDDFLRQPREDIKGCDIEDFRPAVVRVSIVLHKQGLVILTSSRE